MKRIIVATLNNTAGVLNRVTGVMARRRFNIESISVGHSEKEGISRLTFIVNVENENQTEQLTKHLNKQVDVIKVLDITEDDVVERELALIKVSCNSTNRMEIFGFLDPFRAQVVDVGKDTLIIQIVGAQNKVDALIDLLKPFGIREISRTGVIASVRGTKSQEKTNKLLAY